VFSTDATSYRKIHNLVTSKIRTCCYALPCFKIIIIETRIFYKQRIAYNTQYNPVPAIFEQKKEVAAEFVLLYQLPRYICSLPTQYG